MRGLGEDSPSNGLMVCAGALALLYGIVVFAKVKPNTKKKRAPLGSFWASLQSTPPAPRPKRRRQQRLTHQERCEMLAEQDQDEWSRSARRREERDELSVGRRSVGRNRRRRVSRNGVRGYILSGRNRSRDADPFSKMTRADQAAFNKTYTSLPSASSVADRLSDRYDDISFDVKALVSRGGR